jgi:hypothetical protein
MRTRSLAILAGLSALACCGSVAAAPCFVIIDRNDTVIYRDIVPPFDLSATKSGSLDALRNRGEHLMIAEFENCYPVGYISATTGGSTATVDEIVMKLQPAISTSIGSGSYVSTPGAMRPGY